MKTEMLEKLFESKKTVAVDSLGIKRSASPASAPCEYAEFYSIENYDIELCSIYRRFNTWGGGSQGYKYIRKKGEEWEPFGSLWALTLALESKDEIEKVSARGDDYVCIYSKGKYGYAVYIKDYIPVTSAHLNQAYNLIEMTVKVIPTDHDWDYRDKREKTITVALRKH